MTESRLMELQRAASRAALDVDVDVDVEQTLAAALLGGPSEQAAAGLDLLGQLPAGPALVRVVQAMAPESAEFATEVARQRTRVRPQPIARRWAGSMALAAGVAAAAILLVGLRDAPVAPAGGSPSERIMVASFESDGPAVTPASDAGRQSQAIFNGGFDS